MTEAPPPADATAATHRAVVRRRLILAKALYQHGRDLSHQPGALGKMIAIHAMHNAIEVVLRAIMLEYKIRAEKQQNIIFEEMLNAIDKHGPLRDEGKQLPNRQEIWRLNVERNMAQHHAVEPPAASMEEWRAFSHRFLQVACEQYFGENFDELSQISFIDDERLRRLLELSASYLALMDWKRAAFLSKAAWLYAVSSSFEHSLPESREPLVVRADALPNGLAAMTGIIRETFERIGDAEKFAATLAAGVPLADYSRVNRIVPHATLMMAGHPNSGPLHDVERDDAVWLREYVAETVVRWQLIGFSPRVSPGHVRDGFRAFGEFIHQIESELAQRSDLEAT